MKKKVFRSSLTKKQAKFNQIAKNSQFSILNSQFNNYLCTLKEIFNYIKI